MVSPADDEWAGAPDAEPSGSPHRGSTVPERRLPTAANFLRDGCHARFHGCAGSCLFIAPSVRFSLSYTDHSTKFGGHVVGGLSLQG